MAVNSPPHTAPFPPPPPAPPRPPRHRPAEPAPSGRTLVVAAPSIQELLGGRRLALLIAMWMAVALFGMVLVSFGLGPFLYVRDQRVLLSSFRQEVDRAAESSFGLYAGEVAIKAPELGDPVAILEVGSIQLQQTLLEGVSPAETQRAPGHVPGTAMPGQPGNSVVLGRRSTFGAPFADLPAVAGGDEILVTTVQGQVVYRVDKVRNVRIEHALSTEEKDAAGGGEAGDAPAEGSEPAADAAPAADGGPPDDPQSGEAEPAVEVVKVDDLYGATEDDRLTLVTSNASSPFNGNDAVVVTATLQGKPFTPSPPNGRTDSHTGLSGDTSALSALALVLLAFGGSATIAVALYRTRNPLVAYLLSTPPLLAFVVLGGEIVSQLLPAWA